ncbi:CheR family methyltransferase [Caldovatus aquaticus]|uniref:protein-glutamate O-methyltransferase n=1 Tax=Caldovatus aquaticus TaxID=2865671 RepID=A0ABS7EYH4_9PROT|nr:protein-glutamate O-methyltransferase CheR [Caldovatus aquaticus]MBW8268404.1 protein-glutamate O-methyltransferase CheR [Caldovatus aquaticus]
MTRAESLGFLAALVKARSGIVLTPDKAYMLETRLAPLLARTGLASLDALAARLRGGASAATEALAREVVEALTTHESSFFRDGWPFDHLRQMLPRLAAARPAGQPLRIWSAACSTGQEAYSVAMLAADPATWRGAAPPRIEILGTDIAREVLARAREGLYSQFEVQRGLPVQLLVRHFRPEGDGRWRIAPELRAVVRFEEFNLLSDPRPLGRFDVILCRNVLIYFDAPTKTAVLEALAGQLAPDGVLYLGGAETVLGLTDRFRPIPGERTAYAPVPPAAAGPGTWAPGAPAPAGRMAGVPAAG